MPPFRGSPIYLILVFFFALVTLFPLANSDTLPQLDELHSLAITSHQHKKHAQALEHITSAILLLYDAEHSTISRSQASSNLFNTKGVIHKGLHDFPNSLLAFDLAEELDDTKTNYNAYYNRANCLHYNFRHQNLTAEDVSTFLSNPSRRALPGDLEAQFLQAAAADYEKADLIIRSINDPNYDFASFCNDYAICLRKLRDSQGAIDVLLRAVAHSPENLFTRGNLVIALKDARKLAEAAEHSRVAIELDPKNAQIRHNYGLVLQEMGESGREQWEVR